MKTTKCTFKKVTDEDREKFASSNCLLTISIGAQTHENKRFMAMMDLVKKSFKSCTIALHDTLQRHTIAMTKQTGSAEDYYDFAKSLGDSWYERNKEYFGDNTTIVRWDEWIGTNSYQQMKAMILAEQENNPVYKSYFTDSINEYLDRYSKRIPEGQAFDRVRAEKLCFDYLVEECAVLCLWPETGCHYEVYDGSHNKAMNATRERFVHAKNPELLRSLKVGFNHRPDLKPQDFTNAKANMH